MTYTATYSPDDNKLRLYASQRLSTEEYTRVRAAGFIWAAKQGLFVAPMWTPDRADLLLELCDGEIGDEDTSLTERAEERAERFGDYRESRQEDARQAQAAVSRITDGIPMGQPILVGHHSERHARKDAERIENGMRKAVRMWETAQYWKHRAAGAVAHAKYKELPSVRARRIKGIEADKRRVERAIAESASKLKLWSVEDLTLEQARKIANYANPGVCKQSEERFGYWTAYDVLQPDGERYTACPSMTVEQVQEAAKRAYTAGAESRQRWIQHYDFRLTYERAMLEEQGASVLLAPKPKSAKAQLPLCNYRAPEGLDCENLYNRGEHIHYPQVEMTQAEYAQIPTDYKGTRVVEHSHRIRTTMQRHSLVCVFLTDVKVHAKPAPQDPPPPRERWKPRPVQPAHEADCSCSTCAERKERAQVDALRDTLKAGVQVVSAPQLFPTPTEVARQVVELADIRAGHLVLEPSAGTGALIDAIDPVRRIVNVRAVEVNARLVDRLRARKNPHVEVWCADFLTCNGDLGTFDRIVMNPPFERGSDIKHIRHAQGLLREGGRLVAICAAGPRQREAFEPEAEAWIDLPDDTFKAQGTGVRTAIVVLGPRAGAESTQVQSTPSTSTARAQN